MAADKSKQKNRNPLVIYFMIFILGFLTGVGFTVFKTGGTGSDTAVAVNKPIITMKKPIKPSSTSKLKLPPTLIISRHGDSWETSTMIIMTRKKRSVPIQSHWNYIQVMPIYLLIWV